MASAIALLSITPAAATQAARGYPERPIRLLIAQAPGGNADIIARALADGLAERLGQSIVADNRPGASGIIATETTVRAAPDGYTILLVPSSFGVNPAVTRKLPYDQLRDLAPITLVASAPNVLVVGPALPIKSVADLVKAAKANPGKLTYGSSGNLGSPHLAGELFELMTGTDMVHVPYKGAATAMVDLIGGRISLSFASLPSAKEVWHVDVTYDAALSQYHALLCARDTIVNTAGAGNRSLYFLTSSDGDAWTVAALILDPLSNAWDGQHIYRASMVRTASGYDIWYGGVSTANAWRIGRTSMVLP